MKPRNSVGGVLARSAAIAVATVAAVGAPIAHADVASDVASDLAASGVNASVTVSTPPPATAPRDDAPIPEDQDTSPSYDSMKPFLSPDPFAPLPVITARWSIDAGSQLAGLLPVQGVQLPTTTTPLILESQLALVEAMKHAMARGSNVAGIDMEIAYGSTGPPLKALQAAPNPNIFPPRQSFTSLMPIDEVRAATLAALPTWARAAARSEVTEDAVGERTVHVSVALPTWAVSAVDITELPRSLDEFQVERVSDGANVGRTIVRVEDTQSGDPIYASANDALFGYQSEWYSPLVTGFAGAGQQLLNPELQALATDVSDAAKPVTDSADQLLGGGTGVTAAQDEVDRTARDADTAVGEAVGSLTP